MSAKAKRVVRTVFQTAVALAAGLPLIISASGADAKVGGVAISLAVAGAVTRVMALPVSERLLTMVGLGFMESPDPAVTPAPPAPDPTPSAL